MSCGFEKGLVSGRTAPKVEEGRRERVLRVRVRVKKLMGVPSGDDFQSTTPSFQICRVQTSVRAPVPDKLDRLAPVQMLKHPAPTQSERQPNRPNSLLEASTYSLVHTEGNTPWLR